MVNSAPVLTVTVGPAASIVTVKVRVVETLPARSEALYLIV